MTQKHGPCLDKKCSWCCDPVRVRKGFPDEKIPKDSTGKPIWEKRDEILVPEDHPDTVRIDTYECRKLNKTTGLCEDYENRPEICRDSGCVDGEETEADIDRRHKEVTEQKFITLRPYRKK